jgi:hypothetical protein
MICNDLIAFPSNTVLNFLLKAPKVKKYLISQVIFVSIWLKTTGITLELFSEIFDEDTALARIYSLRS